jgi:hypothetical protein
MKLIKLPLRGVSAIVSVVDKVFGRRARRDAR